LSDISDVYKYDFSFVENCNSYNIFSCVWNLKRCTWKPDNVIFVISVIRKHQQPFAFLISEYKFATR
jgi:hypothetical protein